MNDLLSFTKLDELVKSIDATNFIPKNGILSSISKGYYNLLLFEIQEWLMDKHMIRVFVGQSVQGIFRYSIHTWAGDNQVGKWKRIGHPLSYDTYSIALRTGLIEALQILKDRDDVQKNK